MTPKGYRVATEDDIGKKCLFTNIPPSFRVGWNVLDYMHGELIGTEKHLHNGSYRFVSDYDKDCEFEFCYVKKENKTITLDPMLDARLTNIDRMILEREIELRLLRKLKGEENE